MARHNGIEIIMAHECDLLKGVREGCEFVRFFGTTPQKLISGGLYEKIEIACHAKPYRRDRLSDARSHHLCHRLSLPFEPVSHCQGA